MAGIKRTLAENNIRQVCGCGWVSDLIVSEAVSRQMPFCEAAIRKKSRRIWQIARDPSAISGKHQEHKPSGASRPLHTQCVDFL